MGLALAIALAISMPRQESTVSDRATVQLVVDLVTRGNEAQRARSSEFEAPYLEAIEAAASLEPRVFATLGDYLAVAHHGVATAERDRGQIEQAIVRVQRAEATLALSPPYRAILLSMHGDLLLELGLPDRADGPIQEAFALALEDLRGGSPNWGGVFLAHARRSKQLLAQERYREAAQVVEELEASLDWSTVFGGRDPERAARERATLATYAGVAWAALAATDATAEAPARAALERVLAEPHALPADRFTARGRLAHLALRDGESARASELLLALRAESQATGRTLPREEETWLAALEAALAEQTEEGRDGALERLGSSFLALMEERRAVARSGGVGYFRYGRARMFLEELVALATPEQALQWIIESQAVGTLWHAFGGPRPSAESVLAHVVGPGVGCLVFVNGESRAQCLVIDENGRVERFELEENARVLMQLTREYMAALQQDPSLAGPRRARDLEEDGERLAKALFPEPVRAALCRWKAVRIVGRDLLECVAVEAIPVLDGKPLGLTHAVSELPSLAIAVALARRHAPPPTTAPLLLVDAAVPDAVRDRFRLTPLAISTERLAALLESAPLAPELLRGDGATIAALERAFARHPPWVHLFAHGVRDDARELRTIIALASDASHPEGYLTVETVRAMHAPPLVILSVCRSGDGAERTGDSGTGHFGGAFLTAGARCVLLSPEQIQLTAALEMSAVLYRELREPCTPAEALRRARLVLAADDRWADPFHWALMQAYGFDAP